VLLYAAHKYANDPEVDITTTRVKTLRWQWNGS
jgi:hypothetical protein